MGMACIADILGIGREDSFIVGLAVFGINLLRFGIQLIAVSLERILHHADAPFGEDAAFEGSVGLQTHDNLIVLVYISGTIGIERLGQFLLSVIDTFLALHLEHLSEFIPQCLGLGRRSCQERVVTGVGRVVVLDKVTNVDFTFPHVAFKAFNLMRKFHNLSGNACKVRYMYI